MTTAQKLSATKTVLASLISLSLLAACGGSTSDQSTSAVADSKLLAATVYNVNTIAELKSALTSCISGDTIVIAAGTYTFSNATKTTGTNTLDGVTAVAAMALLKGKSNVTIRGASATSRPVLKGYDMNGDYVMYLQNAPGTIVKDLILDGSNKGIVIDRSNNVRVQNVEVRNIGSEGIHVRDGSSYAIIINNNIHDVGLTRNDRGEGVYIGSDNDKWNNYPSNIDAPVYYKEACNNNLVKGNKIGPNIGAEPIDEKEGTVNNTYRDNTIDLRWTRDIGTANDLPEYGILLKGGNAVVINNTFTASASATPRNGGSTAYLGAIGGYQILSTSSVWGFGHFITGNKMTGDDAALYLMYFTSNGGAKYGCNTDAVPVTISAPNPTSSKPDRYYTPITTCTTYPSQTRDATAI